MLNHKIKKIDKVFLDIKRRIHPGVKIAGSQGNKVLMVDCSKSLLFGYFSALILGVLLGTFGIFYGVTDQMQSRSEPDVPDLLIAIISGMAAAYCYARPKLVSALAGVAIAAALIPPIATAGIAIAMNEQKIAIETAMKTAMRAKDKTTLGTIRLILADIKRIEVDERIDIDDLRVLSVLDKMLKQRRDSIEQYRTAGREDLALIEEQEMVVIQSFLSLIHI